MGLGKLKKVLQEALKNADAKLAKKTTEAIRKKRAEGWKPPFNGAHRGY